MQKGERLNETLFLIGGGPSLKDVDLTPLMKHQDRVLVSNNAFKLFPEAYLAHHTDWCWWEWNKDQFHLFKGKYCSTTGIGANRNDYPKPFIWLKKEGDSGFSGNFPMIRGNNAGYQLMNIAFILGASQIILLGYDLKHGKNNETQWHKEHLRDTATNLWTERMLPEFNAIARPLAKKGIKVYNANLDSAIRCFEFTDDYRKFL